MNKQELEAETAGLELLQKADISYGKGYANYNLYKFKECGHSQYLQPTHVRRNSVTCKVCKEDKIVKESKNTILEYIGLADNGDINFRKYRFRDCEHIGDFRFASVAKRTTDKCSICYEKTLENQAQNAGLTYMGKSERNGVYRRYRFNNCLHLKDIAPQCVVENRFECKDCIDDEKEKLCHQNDLTVVEKHSDGYWTFKLPCNHIKKLRLDHAIDNSWLCDTCGDSHYVKPSLVYLYKFSCPDFEWLKLGFSRNLSVRKANYKIPGDCISTLIYSVPFATGYEAQLVEKNIHKKLKSSRLCKRLMSNYMQNNGHTECYPVCSLDQIMKELI